MQGIWINFDSTPLEAPSSEDTARLAPLEPWFPGISASSGKRTITGPNPSEAFTDIGVKRNAPRRSLIVDPPDGRAPVRPDALEKRVYSLAHLTDSWEFHTPWERCITRGVPGGMLPAGYNNGYRIQYEMTIEDPNVYTRPWKVAIPLNRADDYQLLEYACHEGNYGLPNSLRGARVKEGSLKEGTFP
jgi:hypothetical protein